MVRKKIKLAAMCSLVLCGLLWGCGQGDGMYIGESAKEAAAESFLLGEESASDLAETPESPETEICVYVCGAVNEPGLVTLREGSRVADALEKAGGFREDAGTDRVNLAAKVSDGERLYFPTAQESAEDSEGEDGLVNINTADAARLCTLPGIGESRAADILAYREANGSFSTCEDIMKVPGIKTSVYGKIRDKIKVE